MSSEAVDETKVKKEPLQSKPKLQGLSLYTCAKRVIGDNKISFDPKLHVFNVKGSYGVTRVVTVFPSESCSCP